MATKFARVVIGDGTITLKLNFEVFASSALASSPGGDGDLVRVDLSLAPGQRDALDVRLVTLVAGGNGQATRPGPARADDLLRVNLGIGGQAAGDLVTISLGSQAQAEAMVQARAPAGTATAPLAADADTKSAVQLRLEQVAAQHGIAGLVFKRVPSNYYEETLEWRRDQLGAASVEHLCKSIIMENTRFDVGERKMTPIVDGRIKYVLVVVQYVARLHKERLIDAVRAFEGPKAEGKSKYNLRLIDGTLSDEMSGFEHNAVTPLGLRTPNMPVLIHSAITRLPGGHFWLGGGEVDLKLRFDTSSFLEHFKPVVADICCA